MSKSGYTHSKLLVLLVPKLQKKVHFVNVISSRIIEISFTGYHLYCVRRHLNFLKDFWSARLIGIHISLRTFLNPGCINLTLVFNGKKQFCAIKMSVPGLPWR